MCRRFALDILQPSQYKQEPLAHSRPSRLLSLSVQITALHPPSSLRYLWQRAFTRKKNNAAESDKVTGAYIVPDGPAHALLMPQHICLHNAGRSLSGQVWTYK